MEDDVKVFVKHEIKTSFAFRDKLITISGKVPYCVEHDEELVLDRDLKTGITTGYCFKGGHSYKFH